GDRVRAVVRGARRREGEPVVSGGTGTGLRPVRCRLVRLLNAQSGRPPRQPGTLRPLPAVTGLTPGLGRCPVVPAAPAPVPLADSGRLPRSASWPGSAPAVPPDAGRLRPATTAMRGIG